jgi:VanZ family protein
VRLLKQWLPVILWAGLILSSANDEFSAKQTGGWLAELFGSVPYVVHVLIRKLAHVVVYAILAALAWRADRRWSIAFGLPLGVACIDEWLQSTTLSRTGSMWDVLLDAVAAAIAVVLLSRGKSFPTGSPAGPASPSSPSSAA